MRLITGPPVVAKSEDCLLEIEAHLRKNSNASWRLLVPTATLAEHYRNQLTRRHLVFPPENVTTLAKFAAASCPELKVASEAVLELLTVEALGQRCPVAYRPVVEFPGFQRALASSLGELLSAGGDDSHLPLLGPDFADAAAAILDLLRQRGYVHSAQRFRGGAQAILDGQVKDVPKLWLAGFFSFNNPELELILALAKHAELIVRVVDWSGSAPAIAKLKAIANEVLATAPSSPPPSLALFVAPTVDAEVSEIARQIVSLHADGHRWDDIAIAVRSEDPHVAALRDILQRFGIPARAYFAESLDRYSLVRYLMALVNAMLAQWDHEKTLEALRSAGSPLEDDDSFDVAVRERIPGAGLPTLAKLADESQARFFGELAKLTEWGSRTAYPEVWAERFGSLISLCQTVDHSAPAHERFTQEQVEQDRSDAAALLAWPQAAKEAAETFPRRLISCADYWTAMRCVLRASSLRPADHRRNVVHLIDVFEARQWTKPIVFLCGLVEGQFPKQHSEDPVLPDTARRRLQNAGLPIRTNGEKQSDERFLFETVLASATRQIHLSYAYLNAKGETNLPSYFLAPELITTRSLAVEVRPAPSKERFPEPRPYISDDLLRAEVVRRHAILRATAVETFLQCPHQFFNQETLRLKEPPADAWKRLDLRAQGSFVHRVLERAAREKRPVAEVFEPEFDDFRNAAKIPAGYRTEAVRLELLANLELIEADARLASGAETYFEQTIEIAIDEQTRVRGRIDRLEVDEQGDALIIDYKYKGQASLKRTYAGHEDRTHVQGGLYLIGASQSEAYRVRGMIYCGFKRDITFGGWVLQPHFAHIGEGCSSDKLHEIMQTAREVTAEAAASIRQGEIAPKPADEKRCQFCAFSATCRVEKLPADTVQTADGGGFL